MVKRILKCFFISFLMMTMLFSTIVFADTNNANDLVTFSRKYVSINHLFTVNFNKKLTCKQGTQTIQDIEKLITCTDDVSGKTIPIRASYQVDSTNNSTKLNVQISNENGQPSGTLGCNYTLTINKGIKATDGTITNKTYIQPFTINNPESIDDNIKLMISKDTWITRPKGYYNNDWAVTYPYCSQVLLNDGTMLTNVPIKYANGHVSGDTIQDNDIADGGISTVLKKEGTYVYNGYPIINGVEDTKRLFTFTFQIKYASGVAHINSKIIVGSSDVDIFVYQPQTVQVQLVGGGNETKNTNWITKYNNYSGEANIYLQDGQIYENDGEDSDWHVPFIYYYVSEVPDDDTIFANATKDATPEQINYLKDIKAIMGDSHWNYNSIGGLSLYERNPNQDSIYDTSVISLGGLYKDKITHKSVFSGVSFDNILGKYNFSDFQKLRTDAINLIGADTMTSASNIMPQIDAEIQNAFYPLSIQTNNMLQNKKFSWIIGGQKKSNNVSINYSANTINGKIESSYGIGNGK